MGEGERTNCHLAECHCRHRKMKRGGSETAGHNTVAFPFLKRHKYKLNTGCLIVTCYHWAKEVDHLGLPSAFNIATRRHSQHTRKSDDTLKTSFFFLKIQANRRPRLITGECLRTSSIKSYWYSVLVRKDHETRKETTNLVPVAFLRFPSLLLKILKDIGSVCQTPEICPWDTIVHSPNAGNYGGEA